MFDDISLLCEIDFICVFGRNRWFFHSFFFFSVAYLVAGFFFVVFVLFWF